MLAELSFPLPAGKGTFFVMAQDPLTDERVTRLTTPEECEQFASNVADRLPELARAAKRRAVELKAARYGASTLAEQESVAAVYAYERVLSEKNGRNTHASRTWQMIKRHGIIGAVERAVNRNDDPQGYEELENMGMLDLSFEAVILRHPTEFSDEAVQHARKRLQRWSNPGEVES